MRRSGTDTRRPLQWDFPGGQLEEGEDLKEGIKREIFEESALSVSELSPIWSTTKHRVWDTGEASIVFIFYKARVPGSSSDVKISNEHDMFQWLPITEASRLFEYDLHREVMTYIVDNQLEL